MMTPHITTLPQEIIYMISDYLLPPGQSALSRTCHQLNALLTPVLWSDIELHHRGAHEGMNICWVRDTSELKYRFANDDNDSTSGGDEYPFSHVITQQSGRKYIQPPSWKEWAPSLRHDASPGELGASDNSNRKHFQHGREESLLQLKVVSSTDRWETLSRHVRSLCFSVGVNDEVIYFISSFRNLTSLEIVGLPLATRSRSEWYPEDGPPTDPPPFEVAYPHLKNLRLRGYFPAALVRSICSNAPNITHLDLGLLASMRDDKFHQDGWLERDDDKGPAYETDSEDEEVYPWALHGPLWLHPQVLPSLVLPRLTHLNITRPFLGDILDMWTDSFEQVPADYERALVGEWAALLRANAGTLKEVIFDYRIPQNAGDTVGDGDPAPVHVDSRALTGDLIFGHQILNMFVNEGELFPNLQRLDFRGIRMKNTMLDQEQLDIRKSKKERMNNVELLVKRFPECEINVFQPPYPLYVYAGEVYQHWPSNRHEAMQDSGDGLLYEASYYNDYVKRFGKTWKVKG